MPINKNEITKEMIEKAMQCKTADELIALAKTGGYELTKEEAEKLQNRLEARFHRKMDMVCTVDPALIGGIRVETEGRVLDGSLKARLQEIKEVMNT